VVRRPARLPAERTDYEWGEVRLGEAGWPARSADRSRRPRPGARGLRSGALRGAGPPDRAWDRPPRARNAPCRCRHRAARATSRPHDPPARRDAQRRGGPARDGAGWRTPPDSRTKTRRPGPRTRPEVQSSGGARAYDVMVVSQTVPDSQGKEPHAYPRGVGSTELPPARFCVRHAAPISRVPGLRPLRRRARRVALPSSADARARRIETRRLPAVGRRMSRA
jgi:hypothetical protein